MTQEQKDELQHEMNMLTLKTSLVLLETINTYPDDMLRDSIEFFIKRFKDELKIKDNPNDKT